MYIQNNIPLPTAEGVQNQKIIYALGFFDGVHLGHQALLTACRQLAKRLDCQAGAVTFDTHPEALVAGNAPALINSISDRMRLLAGYGMDSILVLPFDDRLRQLPWQDFLQLLTDKGSAGFVCGDDFRFGFRGDGNPDKLARFCRAHNLGWAVVNAQSLEGTRVSSTHIRKLLEAGDLESANRFLGHPHILSGTVIPGRQLGRTIGVPTANLALPALLVQPKFGVYACTTVIDGKTYRAVTNIGKRPTVEGTNVTVEPWILDFEGDLYGKEISLSFHKFLRPEQKFDSLEDLKAQIRKDRSQTESLLSI